MDPEDDDPYRDQPYTSADLLKPGFDPFEAHRAWIEARKSERPLSLEQFNARLAAKMARIAAAAQEELRQLKLRPKRKPKPISEAKRWREALKAVRRKKRDGD